MSSGPPHSLPQRLRFSEFLADIELNLLTYLLTSHRLELNGYHYYQQVGTCVGMSEC